ncbi:hypothetical protein, partial [Flavobacterium zhairuonense]|uniref:hypothetical protein n=1 Tax=Flavobacterium zhairuonense TaxID=2493631 RepID=UPI001ABFCF53
MFTKQDFLNPCRYFLVLYAVSAVSASFRIPFLMGFQSFCLFFDEKSGFHQPVLCRKGTKAPRFIPFVPGSSPKNRCHSPDSPEASGGNPF